MKLSGAFVFFFVVPLLSQPSIGETRNLLCDQEFVASATPDEITSLVASGADPNEMCWPDGGAFGPGRSTPIFVYALACIYLMENCEIWLDRMSALLEAGADPNTLDERGDTLLVWTVVLGHEAAMDILLKFGADPNLSGGQALNEAVEALFFMPVDLDTEERHRLSQVFVRKLLMSGADPNIQNEDGRTPLHQAARSARMEVIEMLLAAGGDPTIKDLQGVSPSDEAKAFRGNRVNNLFKDYANKKR